MPAKSKAQQMAAGAALAANKGESPSPNSKVRRDRCTTQWTGGNWKTLPRLNKRKAHSQVKVRLRARGRKKGASIIQSHRIHAVLSAPALRKKLIQR